MNKFKVFSGSFLSILIMFFLMVAQEAAGQQTGISSPAIPADLSKIFTHSCTPCHFNNGSKMAMFAVNFDDWTKNTPEKQYSKSAKIVSMLSKDKMPPKSAREKRPDIVPTKEQVEMIGKWSESLKPPA